MKQALEKAQVLDPANCYFIDDNCTCIPNKNWRITYSQFSVANVEAAYRLGWGHCVHFCEGVQPACEPVTSKEKGDGNHDGLEAEVASRGIVQVRNLHEIRRVWPEIFVKA